MLSAAIGRIKEDLLVASLHIHRLENVEVGPILNAAARICRRLVQIDNDFIERIFGIHFPTDFTDEFLVSSGDRELVSVSKNFFSFYDNLGDHVDRLLLL